MHIWLIHIMNYEVLIYVLLLLMHFLWDLSRPSWKVWCLAAYWVYQTHEICVFSRYSLLGCQCLWWGAGAIVSRLCTWGLCLVFSYVNLYAASWFEYWTLCFCYMLIYAKFLMYFWLSHLNPHRDLTTSDGHDGGTKLKYDGDWSWSS